MSKIRMHRLPRPWRIGLLALAVCTLATAHLDASTRVLGSLPRKSPAPPESLPGVDTEYGEIELPDGSKLRTLVTRPQGRTGRLPAVQFVQWLSCDTVEISPQAHDGWSLMLRRLVVDSGALVLRTEKSGVGDSQGSACSSLDYDTELEQHRQSLRRLRERPDVDPQRIVIFGGSIGATFAPLLARSERVAGVAVWGGGARTWFERQLAFDRRAMELSGRPAAEISRAMMRHAEFQWLYLEQRLTPAEIARRKPGGRLDRHRWDESRLAIRAPVCLPLAGTASGLGFRVVAGQRARAGPDRRIRLVRGSALRGVDRPDRQRPRAGNRGVSCHSRLESSLHGLCECRSRLPGARWSARSRSGHGSAASLAATGHPIAARIRDASSAPAG